MKKLAIRSLGKGLRERGGPARVGIGRIGISLIASLVLAGVAAGDVLVTGTIRHEDTQAPLAGALVSLQAAGIRTTTDESGQYALSIPDVSGSVIVAAKKGYFNASAFYSGDPNGVDISLAPVPQDDDHTYQLWEPSACGECHPRQVEQWTDSPMSKAGTNTWVHDIFNGTGTAGGLGGFVYTRDSVYAKSNPNSECSSCHQPEKWIPEPFTAMDDPTHPEYPTPAAMHGISCDVCHKVADVDVSKINFPGIFPGAVTFTRPQGPAYLQVSYGVLGDVDFTYGPAMRASYQPGLVAETCGTCHQDANDPLENHTYTGVISEPTYLEWLDSEYSNPSSPSYASCVDCHMPSSGDTQFCEFVDLDRDPETLRDHMILGTTAAYLENAVELELDAQVVDDELHVDVHVDNRYTGHHVPTGVTVRNVILLVEAVSADDESPLTFTGDQVVHDLGGIGDPAEGYYAGLPGKFFAKVNHDANGNGPTFFTDAAGITFDSRIPAQAIDSSSYTFAIPEGSGDVTVRAQLVYRRAFRFLVDAKSWTEDGHGRPLEDVAAPHFGHLMESAEQTLRGCAGDLDGSGVVDVTDLLTMLGDWGACFDCPSDVNGDEVVDVNDLLVLLAAWGDCG